MENIMLDEKQKNVKLVDFGLSITFTKDELMKTHCGSPEYAAPELFAAKDRYGPEIDVWSLGIVMYAMMLGRLPFTTPYTDHYRRQKLVQQMEKGLTDTHTAEMAILSQDCQDMLRKVIEPSPEKRMPLLDMEVHVWVTNSAKLPFYPFQAFPRDKTMRHQGSPSLRQQTLQDSVCSTDDDETIVELSQKLEMKKEQVEQTVGESKSDEMSAMYNMMLDSKRREQGLYDFDHTSKPMERRDGRAKRRAKSAPEEKEKKSKKKGGVPPALVLPAPEVSVEAAPHTGGDAPAEPETRMTSFDFLALCSTPSWLGPERRRSRRRTRSPNPASQHNRSTDGMSVRSQIKRDYMERQNYEASQAAAAAAREEHGHQSGQHHTGNASHGSLKVPTSDSLSPNLLSPEQAETGHADGEGNNPRVHRGSSLKLSRKRPRSFGPRQKKRSTFQRSGSVDTPMQADSGGHAKLKAAKSDSLAATSPSTLSVAAASLAVAFGGRTSNVLQVPTANASSTPRAVNVTYKGGQSATADNSSNPASLITPERAVDSMASPVTEGAVGGVRGSLASVEVHVSDSATLCPPVPDLLIGATAFKVSGSRTDADLPAPRGTGILELPSFSVERNPTWSTESLMGDSEFNLLPSPDRPDGAAVSSGELMQPLHLLDCSQRPVFHQQVPPHALSLHKDTLTGGKEGEEGATAMQVGVPQDSTALGASHPRVSDDSQGVTDSVRGPADKGGRRDKDGLCADLEPSLRALTLDGLVGATGISGNFKDDGDIVENEVEVTTEDDGMVFSSESDKTQQYLATLPKKRAEGGIPHPELQPELPSPDELDEDLLLMGTDLSPVPDTAPTTPVAKDILRRNQRGSAGSNSQTSSSGSRSQKRGSVTLQGGKLKTPTTPLSWMVMHSPLARIESFHSDDFDLYNSSDNEPGEHCDVNSASPISSNTPTLPCFAYKLNMARKKLPKLKKSTSDHGVDGKTCWKAPNGGDVGRCHPASPLLEPTATDPLLSSGSDTEHMDDSGDKTTAASKAKVHPEDKDCEKKLLKTENKPAVCNNVITQQPKRQAQQNSVNKCVPTLVLDPKKKMTPKSPPWKRSFAYFLKRKKQSPRCNNNNNDCASSPMLPANHNGCSPTLPSTKVESNNVQSSLGVKAMANNSTDRPGEFMSEVGNCKPRVYVAATDNNMAEGPEFQTSLAGPPASPDTGLGGRVFDFTLLNDSPKGRPCLLSWRPCGDCATSDLSSEDESECNPDPVVTLDLKPLANNSVGDGRHSFHTSYQSSGT